jgi:FkbM family methyltransferase
MYSYHQCLSQIEFEPDYQPIFFDVGCNINFIPAHCGVLDDFTELCLNKHPNSKCYGIDPLHWQAYEEKYKDNSKVTLLKTALSDKVEKRTLYIPGADDPVIAHAISSLWNRKDFACGIKEVEVDCTTIDLLMFEHKLDKIDYLKIDAEGAELYILKGAKKALENKKINFIQVEFPSNGTSGTYEDAGYTPLDLINYLNKNEYVEIFETDSEKLFTFKENLT